MQVLEQRTCAWDMSDWQSFVQENVEQVNEMRLVSKLSGAGVVTRALEVPETDKLWFGRMKDDCIQMAQCLPSVNVSAYQPIVTVRILGQSDMNLAENSVEIQWAPHPDANMLAMAEWMGAGLCVISGIVGMQQNPLAGLAIAFGIILLIVPRYRARWNFEREMYRAQDAFSSLAIPWSKSL